MKNSDLARLVRRHMDTSAKPHEGHRATTPGAGPYAAWHRTCGHAVAIHADRAAIEAMIASLRGSGRFALRVRIATTDDIESCTRGITCNLCRGLA